MDTHPPPTQANEMPGYSQPTVPDNNFELLAKGIETGFSMILEKLSRVEDRFDNAVLTREDALRESCGESQSDHANFIVNTLEEKNQELVGEVGILEERIRCAESHIQDLSSTERGLRNEIVKQKQEIARLQQKETQFREIIIGKAGAQEFTDQEIIQAFSSLRQKVQQLTSSSIFDLKSISSYNLNPKRQKTKHFYAICRTLPNKDIVTRMKSQIFLMLHSHILGETQFGLKRFGPKDSEASNFSHIERGLVFLEKYLLSDPKVDVNAVADWRISTLDCISMLKLPNEYIPWVVHEIFHFLAPLISSTASKTQEDSLWSKIEEVCEQAVQLKMMTQQSKEIYTIMGLNIKETPLLSKIEYLADALGVENGTSADVSDEIAYQLFGALTKESNRTGGDKKVLVKAEVILKRKASGPSSSKIIPLLSYFRGY